MNWVPLFIWFELVFSLPLAIYSLYAFGVKRAGTTGPYELLMLVYAFETAFTTAVCIHDVQYWDPKVYSPAQKNMFMYQLFGPWLVVRECSAFPYPAAVPGRRSFPACENEADDLQRA